MLPRSLPAGFIEPCLPSPAPKPPGAGWIHEIKLDGFRLQEPDGARGKARGRRGLGKEALAISVPAGETRVLKYFQERMPYGLFVPNVSA
jgi:hypothetical protein